MKTISTLAALLIAASMPASNIAQAAVTPDEQFRQEWPTPPVNEVAYWGMLADDKERSRDIAPHLLAFTSSAPQLYGTPQEQQARVTSVHACSSINDAACATADLVNYTAVLPMCSADAERNCIEAITAKDGDGNPLEVSIVGGAIAGRPQDVYEGSSAHGLPSGNSAPRFTIEGVKHPGGGEFLATVSMSGVKSRSQTTFATRELQMRVHAVRMETGSYPVAFAPSDMERYNNAWLRWDPPVIAEGDARQAVCVVNTANICAMPYALPLNIRLGLAVRLSQPLNAWLHGRMRDANAAVSLLPSGGQLIAIEAVPVRVPTVYGWVPKSEAPDAMKAYYADKTGGSGFCFGNTPVCDSSNWFSTQSSASFSAEGLRELQLWLPVVRDTAKVAPTAWSVRVMQNAWSGGSHCTSATESLVGIVMTNATAYVSGPPSFNAATQTLDYKVLAPHYLPDGTTFSGTYDLAIRSTAARCLYGFSDAPISASVTVVSETGEQQTAVTSVSERDGFLRLSASGFTFSSPTVKVQLKQAQRQTAQSAPSASVKRTITCVKGKKSKRIVAVNPKCPVGWKRK